MSTAQPRDERRLESASAICGNTRAERFDVRVRFGASAEATRYLRALASLFFGASTKVTATLTTGTPREDLTAEEISDRLSRAVIEKLRFVLPLGEQPLTVEIGLVASEPSAVAIRAPFASAPAKSRLWLQCDADVVTPIPALALPTTTDGLALDAAHALIGLAARSGGFHDADLVGEHPVSWATVKPDESALPVRSALHDAVWSTAGEPEGPVVAWVSGLLPPVTSRAPDAGYWERYGELTRRPREALAELQAHLAMQFEIPFAWLSPTARRLPRAPSLSRRRRAR